jgi:hypothetical protein
MEILGVGPLELALILIIALIVLGPKDMVKAGRTMGKFLRKVVMSPTWKAVQQTSRDLKTLPNRLMREAGLALAPTFIPFTPWTTWESYRDLLRTLADLDLVENVAPVQLAIRLLIPGGSRLLELAEVRALAGDFDPRALVHPWRHQDPSLDRLARGLQELVKQQDRRAAPRSETFAKIWQMAHAGASLPEGFLLPSRATIPYLTEPWYC